jgi:flagellar biosynthesis protein FlhB
MTDKTEEPTPRRLRRAREQGDSPVSGALGPSLGLIVGALLVPSALVATATRAAALVEGALHGQLPAPNATASVLAREVLSLVAPLLAAVAAIGLAAGLVQTGAVVSGARLTPKLERLDPVQGFSNLFRAERLFTIARSALGAASAIGLAWVLFRNHAADVAAAAGNLAAVGPLVTILGKKLAVWVGLVSLGLGLVDVLFVQRAWRARHRMSKHEIKREFREAEGDPEMRARRKRAHHEALQGSIINAVRQASVVIVNPTHLASALRYVPEQDEAPKLVAQGEGELARHIVEAARAYGIPCVTDVPIARALRELEIGDEIPEALYEAVAEILRTVMEPASEELRAADSHGGSPSVSRAS